jgi:hypothetical protein
MIDICHHIWCNAVNIDINIANEGASIMDMMTIMSSINKKGIGVIMTKTTKTNEKYGTFGLTKEDGVTTFESKGIDDLPAVAQVWLANYGLFVCMTRTWAGHEKATNDEKKELFVAMFKWLEDGCPKRKQGIKSAEEKAQDTFDATAASIRKATEHGTPAEKKMAESIIATMQKDLDIKLKEIAKAKAEKAKAEDEDEDE